MLSDAISVFPEENFLSFSSDEYLSLKQEILDDISVPFQLHQLRQLPVPQLHTPQLPTPTPTPQRCQTVEEVELSNMITNILSDAILKKQKPNNSCVLNELYNIVVRKPLDNNTIRLVTFTCLYLLNGGEGGWENNEQKKKKDTFVDVSKIVPSLLTWWDVYGEDERGSSTDDVDEGIATVLHTLYCSPSFPLSFYAFEKHVMNEVVSVLHLKKQTYPQEDVYNMLSSLLLTFEKEARKKEENIINEWMTISREKKQMKKGNEVVVKKEVVKKEVVKKEVVKKEVVKKEVFKKEVLWWRRKKNNCKKENIVKKDNAVFNK